MKNDDLLLFFTAKNRSTPELNTLYSYMWTIKFTKVYISTKIPKIFRKGINIPISTANRYINRDGISITAALNSKAIIIPIKKHPQLTKRSIKNFIYYLILFIIKNKGSSLNYPLNDYATLR